MSSQFRSTFKKMFFSTSMRTNNWNTSWRRSQMFSQSAMMERTALHHHHYAGTHVTGDSMTTAAPPPSCVVSDAAVSSLIIVDMPVANER
jgi:hypothetical protein